MTDNELIEAAGWLMGFKIVPDGRTGEEYKAWFGPYDGGQQSVDFGAPIFLEHHAMDMYYRKWDATDRGKLWNPLSSVDDALMVWQRVLASVLTPDERLDAWLMTTSGENTAAFARAITILALESAGITMPAGMVDDEEHDE